MFSGAFRNTLDLKKSPDKSPKKISGLRSFGYFEKHTPLFRKSRYKPNLESTCRGGGGWRRSEYANASYGSELQLSGVVLSRHVFRITWPFPLAQAQVVPLKPLRGVDSLTSGLFLCPVNKIQFMIILWSRIYICRTVSKLPFYNLDYCSHLKPEFNLTEYEAETRQFNEDAFGE